MIEIRHKIKINGSLDRTGNHRTPTESDSKCPAFYERFIGHGSMNERRAICEAQVDAHKLCDYRHVYRDGTALCLRYWYGPKYEIVDTIEEPYIQKVENGLGLYYDAEGNETTTVTKRRVMIRVSELLPVPYLENFKVQRGEADKKPVYLNILADPPVETYQSSGKDSEGNEVAFPPVFEYTKPHFFSTQYEDTHGKIFKHVDNKLGWHHDV